MRLGIGERITLLRRRLNLSQSEVAQRVGFFLGEPPPTQATMSAWETGKSEPKLSEAVALAHALEASLAVVAGVSPLPPVAVRSSSGGAA